MLSLAALRFRTVMAEHGGPIEKIELADVFIGGRRHFQANAYVRTDILPCPDRQVFSNATGTGTATSPLVARYKAVSEAMERWAYHAVMTEGRGRLYGFDIDASSTGMAAFPGLWARSARPAALAEATERFNLLSWWEGHLAALEIASGVPGVSAAVISSELPGVTVIVWRHAAEGHYAYGYACDVTLPAAIHHAIGEMERHDMVLKMRSVVAIGQPTRETGVVDLLERRSLYFSTPSGHELFLERLRGGAPRRALGVRRVYDGPIPGPWSSYAPVWRIAFAPPSDRFVSDDPHYFFW